MKLTRLYPCAFAFALTFFICAAPLRALDKSGATAAAEVAVEKIKAIASKAQSKSAQEQQKQKQQDLLNTPANALWYNDYEFLSGNYKPAALKQDTLYYTDNHPESKLELVFYIKNAQQGGPLLLKAAKPTALEGKECRLAFDMLSSEPYAEAGFEDKLIDICAEISLICEGKLLRKTQSGYLLSIESSQIYSAP
jgi:hypothetical protein